MGAADQQHEVLRLADKLEDMAIIWSPSDNRDLVNSAAAELRRLHAAEVGSTAELLRRQNMIDSLEGLAESLRAELSRLQTGGQGVEPVAWTVAGDVTNWARDFSKYRTQHYVRPVYAHPPAAPALVPLRLHEVAKVMSRVRAQWKGAPTESEYTILAREFVAEFCRINGLTVGDGGVNG